MSIEANKQIVIEHFRLMNQGEYLKAIENFSEDMLWWVAGSDAHGGSNSKQHLIDAYTHQLPTYFPNGFTQTIEHIFGEGDWVVAYGRNETECSGVGERYSNAFSWIFEIKDGQVMMLREYFDTAHAKVALFGG